MLIPGGWRSWLAWPALSPPPAVGPAAAFQHPQPQPHVAGAEPPPRAPRAPLSPAASHRVLRGAEPLSWLGIAELLRKRDPHLFGEKATVKWTGKLLPRGAGRDKGSYNQVKPHIRPVKLSFASPLEIKQAGSTFAFHFLVLFHNYSTVIFWRQRCESTI